ncbi:MAG: ABC transporter permease [Spirochaetaceae bacterium]|nr:ABC transporter permease [Spirochaetaceae bacterium]
MLDYVTRRFAYMLLMIAAMSLVAFIIIQLPPGDYLTMYVRQLEASGEILDESEIESLRRQYGLDQPQHVRYLKWVGGMFRGDFGRSVQWSKSVISLVGERLLLTIVISLGATLFTYVVAISVGIYSATHQYSLFDYSVTIVGFVGLATPNFLLALVLMIVFNNAFGISIGGLFSPEYSTAPWSLGKVWDMIKPLPVPIIVLGTAGTAGVIRVMRGMLLDELRKQYVITARTKGLSEPRLLFRYPVRLALNPIVSTVGWGLPAIVSGDTITALVLSLPTVGPLLFRALLTEDMYLAGTIVMFLCFLTIIGMFVSDMILAAIDPRIRFEKAQT